jgi:cell division transport system permease protein
VAALKQAKGIVSARVLEPAETAHLLEPWLGNSVPIDTLPLPRLVDVRVDPRVPIDYATVTKQLASIVPNSQLDNNRAWIGGVRNFALRVEGVISTVVIVVTALIIAIIIFTARIGLAIHRSVIELLHLMGAQDSYIARQFQIHALGLGLRGGLIGGIAAAATVIILGPAGRALDLPVPIAAYSIVDWRMWALLIVAGLAAGAVAMMTARITVLRQLARMP